MRSTQEIEQLIKNSESKILQNSRRIKNASKSLETVFNIGGVKSFSHGSAQSRAFRAIISSASKNTIAHQGRIRTLRNELESHIQATTQTSSFDLTGSTIGSASSNDIAITTAASNIITLRINSNESSFSEGGTVRVRLNAIAREPIQAPFTVRVLMIVTSDQAKLLKQQPRNFNFVNDRTLTNDLLQMLIQIEIPLTLFFPPKNQIITHKLNLQEK